MMPTGRTKRCENGPAGQIGQDDQDDAQKPRGGKQQSVPAAPGQSRAMCGAIRPMKPMTPQKQMAPAVMTDNRPRCWPGAGARY